MDLPSPPPPLGTRMMAPRACTRCGARMPMDFSRPDVECRCPEGHEHWYFDRPERKWRRIEAPESTQASAV